MVDSRIIATQSFAGANFRIAFVVGAKGKADVYLPGSAPVPDPSGTQAEQSQGRLVFDFDQFEARFDIVPDGDPLPGFTPQITAQNLTIGEDGVLTGQFAATDQDDNIDATSWRQIGSLVGFNLAADGSFTYTPPSSFQSLDNGETATVSVIVTLDDLDGNTATPTSFDIVITGSADAPTINATPLIVTSSGASVTFDLTASDPEDDVSATGFSLSTLPVKGLVTIDPSGLGCVFDPNGGYDTLAGGAFEDETFGVTVVDDQGLPSDEYTVTVRVTGSAAAPVATDGGIVLGEDDTVATAFDLLSLIAPAPGGAPIATVDLVTSPADMTISNFNPATGQGLILPSPTAFQVLKGGQAAQRPFKFRGVDENGLTTNSATFTVTVQGIEDATLGFDRTMNVDAGASISSTLSWSDVEGDGLYTGGPAFEFVGAPFDVASGETANIGLMTLDDPATGAVTFDTLTDFDTLDAGLTRTIRQLWRVRTGAEGTWSPLKKLNATVRGTYLNVDNPPVMTAVAFGTNAGVPAVFNLIANTTDPDNDIVGWEIMAQPQEGGVQKGIFTLESDGTYPTGRLRYSPGNAYDGLILNAHAFPVGRVRAIDAQGNPSAEVDVTIDVLGQAQAPVAQNFSITLNADGTFSGTLPVATDPNGNLDPNGYAIFNAGSAATDGIITVNPDRTVTYDPNGVFDGLMTGQQAVRTFTYTAKDTTPGGALVSSPATITVNINGVAMMANEPIYPAMAALQSKYPTEAGAMARLNALEQVFPADRVSAKSGAWTDPAVWSPSGVPQAGENVKIAWGHTVTFNEARTLSFAGNKAYGLVSVHGTLIMAPFMNVRLRQDTLIGFYGAHFESAPSLPGVIHEISVPANGDIDVLKDPALLTRGIVWHGTTKVMGYGAGTAAEKDPYVNCLRTALPAIGATSLQLERAPVGWNVGDRLIIPCAEQDRSDGTNIATFEDEEVTVTAINGAIISFTPALVFNHNELPAMQTDVIDYGDGSGTGGDWPELTICNFSRNIKFTNEGGNSIPVHQRPYIMIMHRTNADGIQWCDSEINDFGRTNKDVQSFTPGQMGTNPIVATTNLKGRYGLHMHWVGVDPTDDVNHGMFELERNALYRTPGWAIAHHRGQGCLEDNVSFDAFGHFVAEGGDETGEWNGNVAIRGRARRVNGTLPIVKSDFFVSNHDNAATGQGFFFQGRLVNTDASARGWNRVYGTHGDGVVWMHRPGSYMGGSQDHGPNTINEKNWINKGALCWNPALALDQINIVKTSKWQITGCFRGMHIIKANPEQHHGVRSFVDDVIITGAVNGWIQQYTQHYTNRRHLIVRGRRLPYGASGRGVTFYNNTPDMVLLHSKLCGHPGHADQAQGGWRTAIELTHIHVGATFEPEAGAWGYVFDSVKFGAQCGGANNVNDHPNFLETRTGQDGVTGPEDLAFNMTFFSPQSGAVVSFGPPPNPYSTRSQVTGFYVKSQQKNPASAAQYDKAVANFQYITIVTDAFGLKRVPAYYGVQDAISPNGSMDYIRRERGEVVTMLDALGYWSWNGQFYVEDVIITQSRAFNEFLVDRRPMYLKSDTPGINGNPPTALWGNKTFVFNGVKAPGSTTPPTTPQKYYTRFTINHGATIPADQPILLHHSQMPGGAAHLLFQKAQSNLGDLKLYTDATLTTRLPIDIVAYDAATARLLVWTRRPTSTPTGTQIWAEFGGATGQTQPAADQPFGSQAVWAGYNTVSHNLTTNAVNGGAFTIFGTTLIGTNTTSPVPALNGYPARRFNGSNTDSANIVVSSAVQESFFCAAYREGPGVLGSGRIKHSPAGPDLGFNAGGTTWALELEDTNSGAGGSHPDPEFQIAAGAEDQWDTVGYKRNGETTPVMFLNGAPSAVTTIEGFTGTFVPSNENTAFGNHHPDNRDRGYEGAIGVVIMKDSYEADGWWAAFDAMVQSPASFASADAGGTAP